MISAVSIVSCLMLLYVIAVSISAIYIGVVDPVDPAYFPINLQVWLIVFGVMRLTSPIGFFSHVKNANKTNVSAANLVANIDYIFNIVWLIWGTYLIAVYDWLSPRMYALALAIIIIEWILVTTLLVSVTILITKKFIDFTSKV